MKIGPSFNADECEFMVWSPAAEKIELKIVYPEEKILPMVKDESSCWNLKIAGLQAGTRYFYRINGKTDRPDPASNYQPEDVHGASEVVDHTAFKWSDKKWKGLPLNDSIIYEIHTGTFTPAGTFQAAADKIGFIQEKLK